MNEELNKLLKETQELLTVIKNAQIQGNSFDQQYGWNPGRDRTLLMKFEQADRL